jgi:hypothetical protein
MPQTKFRKGDPVKFSFGMRTVKGIVTEDRGPIGINARRLYAVAFHPESQSESTSLIELPAEELQPLQKSDSK